MIDYTLSFQIPKFPIQLQHQDELIMIGSCFSDEISNKLQLNGFNVFSNPFGTIFHPICLSEFIHETITEKKEERIILRNDVFLSWDANSTVYGLSETELLKKLSLLRSDFLNKLIKSKFLFITFGTAWGYHLKDSTNLVANCHKMNQNLFTKSMSTVQEIVHSWKLTIERIKSLNPSINIFFTVSPVRHVKDGLIENNQSKAILIESIRQINKLHLTHYFPSYEILIDELRDYRFYKSDKIHPSEEAIEYIWSKFIETFCSEETRKLSKEVKSIKIQLMHKYINPESTESKLAQQKLKIKIDELNEKYPFITL